MNSGSFKNVIYKICLQIIYIFIQICMRIKKDLTLNNLQWLRGCPRGVMVKVMDCEIVVHELILQARYYVHFRANTLGKGMNPLILPAMG